MSETPLAIASRFATALDAEDYGAAIALLAEDCVYTTGTTAISGAEAIIESYRANGEKARRRFDEIEYASSVESSGPSSAIVNFTDRIRIGNEWHEYRCRQHIRVGHSGQVEEIRHEELPDERARLVDFEGRRTRPAPDRC